MKKEKDNQDIIDSYDYLANAASTTDCTGLIPSLPISKAEIESYQDVYRFEPPQTPVSVPDAEQPPK